MAPGPMTPAPPAPMRTTPQELHTHGGVPPGWTFLMPPGDPTADRKVFVALECFSCHAIKGEDVPVNAGGIGPELTGMGAHHPAEYFAEKLMNPNRVIIEGPGYTGPDGRSTMPDYTESLTVRQLIDVVAYLKSLAPAGSDPMGHAMDGSGQKQGM